MPEQLFVPLLQLALRDLYLVFQLLDLGDELSILVFESLLLVLAREELILQLVYLLN